MTAEYLVHGVTLTLAWFAAINAVASAASLAVVQIVSARAVRPSARFWMALRLAPAASSLLVAALLFAPSYWKYEPRESVEGFDLTLTLLAVTGFVMILAGIIRGTRAWLTATRRVREWMRISRRIELPGTTLPTYVVDVDHPMLALAGAMRPKLLVTRGLLQALTTAELAAAIAHEMGHRRSFDNLKRLCMSAAPDMLNGFRAARRIERRWAAAAEHAADRIGGPDTAAARCALAAALVKVARLTPPSIGHAEPISALIAGGEIASRVQRLLSDDDYAAPPRRWLARTFAAIGGVTIVATVYAPLLQQIHEATELFVRALP